MRKFAGQLATYTVATMLARGTIVISLVVLPLFLAPAEYGALGLITTINALFLLVAPMEISQGLARYYGTATPEVRKDYMSTAWSFTVGMVLVWTVLLLLLLGPFSNLLLGSTAYGPVMAVAVGLFAFNALNIFIQNQFRWAFRTADYVLVSLLSAFTSLGLSIALAASLPDPLMGAVAGQALGGALAMATGIWRLRDSLSFRIDRALLRRMLRFSFPLMIAGTAIFLNTYASRLILNGLLNLESVGIFTLASQIATLPSLTILGIQAFLSPLIMTHYEEPETPASVARLFEGFIGVSACVCLAFGLAAPEAMLFVGQKGYEGVGQLVIVLAPGYLMLQMYVFAPGFLIAERTGLQLFVSLCGGLIAVVANFALINLFGLYGAAIAVLVTATMFLGLWFALSHRHYPIPVRWGKVAVIAAAFGAIALAGSALGPYPLAVSILFKSLLLVAMFGVVLAVRVLPMDMLLSAAKRLRGAR